MPMNEPSTAQIPLKGRDFAAFSNASRWEDTLIIPAVVAALSAALLFVHLLWASVWGRKLRAFVSKSAQAESSPGAAPPVGTVIFAFKLVRLVACLALLGLSLASLALTETHESETGRMGVLRKWGKKHPKNEKGPEVSLTGWLQMAMCATYFYASLLAIIEVSVKRRWSTVVAKHLNVLLIATLFVYVYRDIFPLITYHRVPLDIDEGWILWAKMITLCIAAAIVPLFIPRQYIPVDPKNPMAVPNPEQTASIVSLMLYFFLDPIVYLGYRVPHLSHDQLPPLCDYDYSSHLKAKNFKHIDVFAGTKRHLFFGLLRIFRFEYLYMAVCLVINATANFASPIGINRLLAYLENPDSNSTAKPWFWILWLLMGPLVASVSMQWYIYVATHSLVHCEALITQLVFEHALRIRVKAETTERPSLSGTTTPEASVSGIEQEETNGSSDETLPSTVATDDAQSQDQTPSTTATTKPDVERSGNASNLVGKMTNLVTTDLRNITEARNFLFVVVLIPMMIIYCVVFLYLVLGWSAFVGMGIMIALFPVPGYVAKLVQTVQQKRLERTDARVQVVTETINVLRMIKLFGWEREMQERVAEKREEELNWIWKAQLFDFMLGTLKYTVIMKQELSAATVFSSMSVFNILSGQLFMIFWALTATISGKVSLDRVNDFLHKTELLDEFAEKSSGEQLIEPVGPATTSEIGFRDATFTWSNDTDGSLTPSRRKFILKIKGEVLFKRDCINLVVGPTGSGNISLLMALLGEMHFVPSTPSSWYSLPRARGVAYAAQESWVLNETIKENILFGQKFDAERYQKVIHACALERDLELFAAGDGTEVGEKGLTLSGGQKARITLARAVYSDAAILLLDDVLAALDVHTAKWIVDKCLRGDLIKGRTVILVTHNVAVAKPIANFVVSMDADGRVHSQGTIAEALAMDKVLAEELSKDQAVLDRKEDEVDALPATADLKEDSKLIVAEEIAEGHVGWPALKLYLKGLGGDHALLFFTFLLLGLALTEISMTLQTWYLGFWASQYNNHHASEVDVFYYLGIFNLLVVSGLVIYAIAYIFYMLGAFRASKSIHKQFVESVLGTTLRWLDITPTSRVMVRATVDIGTVDGSINQGFWDNLTLTIAMMTKFAAVVLFTPMALFSGAVIGALGGWIGQIYIKAQLSVKREMSNAKAPVLGHFSAAMAGLISIRAYGAQDTAIKTSLARIDQYTRTARSFSNLNRWISVRIDALGGIFAASLAYYLVYVQSHSASNIGFSLNMAIGVSGMILWWVRQMNEFEVQCNSLERIQGYLTIEQEPKPTTAGIPPAYWPASGKLSVEKLSARYSAEGPKVLHDISFEIKSGERIGVVGRTGSGKSSLTLSLLRCILTSGTVYYDGIATSELNLDALRKNITIIPQVPELLTGSLRKNLDLFEQYDDETLNNALRASGLFALQSEMDEGKLTLDSEISSGGGNLSVGQRQILALARAIVRGSKLLILDEATSAIDYKTDAVIQSSLRNELASDVTILTVAHRLQTIMDADKIMVLDAGRIVEFDSPQELLQNPHGLFRALVDESGDKAALYEMAQSK
ncbi:hypothetical protein C8J57DRAFT_1446843 [Mycena rebaudengoi]|nr:hypothetical protein C8J57DRAFT_1446843 [Mycena rebaudengoi]